MRSQGESRHNPPCRGRSNHQGALGVISTQEDQFQGRCRGWHGGVFSQKLWFLRWIIAAPGSLIHSDSRELSCLYLNLRLFS